MCFKRANDFEHLVFPVILHVRFNLVYKKYDLAGETLKSSVL